MTIKKFENFINKETEDKINNSGLFYWKSDTDIEIKLHIIEWYNKLSKEEKNYIDILQNESYTMGLDMGDFNYDD